MKVAVVRGPSLNPWEMQSYAFFPPQVRVVAVGSLRGHYDLSSVTLPIKRLPCLGEYLAYLPGGIAFLSRFLGDPQYLIGFDRFIKGFDIVHVAELGSAYSLQAVRAKEKGLVKRVCVSVWETIPFLGDDSHLRRAHKQEVQRRADCFVAVTKRVRESLIQEGVDPEKIVVIPVGVDLGRFASSPVSARRSRATAGKQKSPQQSKLATGQAKLKVLREKWGFDANDFVVLSVGRMVVEKGWGDVLCAAYEVQSATLRLLRLRSGQVRSGQESKVQSLRRIRFLCVGEGPQRKRFERQAKNLGLEESVVFAGGVDYGAMPDVYRVADLFVLASRPTPSWEEQFGVVLVEAMAAGVPVIASRTGAIPEVVGESGVLVEPGDVEGLTEAIRRFARDEGLRKKMGRMNRRRMEEKFDARVVAEKIYGVWERVLRNRR